MSRGGTRSEAPGSSAKMHVLGPHTRPNPGTTLPSAEPKSSDRTPLLLRPSPTQRGRRPAAQPPRLCSDQVRHQPRQPPRSCPSLNAHPSSGPCLAAASIWNVPPWAASLTCPRSPGRHAGPWREEAYAMCPLGQSLPRAFVSTYCVSGPKHVTPSSRWDSVWVAVRRQPDSAFTW